jgi:PAS domain S-box-containing protein
MPELTEQLEEQAALYAAGALSARERAQFDLVLEFHHELRMLVRSFEELAAAAVLATQPNDLKPSPALKDRLLGLLDDRAQQRQDHGFVMAGPDGLVQWVNESFTAMCGYTLDELKGRRLGPILQGEHTDKATAARMREAVRTHRPCSEALVNYHKNGSPYWVSINITPLHDADGKLLWMVAREIELPERTIAA